MDGASGSSVSVNFVSRNASAAAFAIMSPQIIWPMQRTFASLIARHIFAANTLSTTAARTPLKRLAIMLMPMPVPQKRNARFASPLWSARHTSTALSK